MAPLTVVDHRRTPSTRAPLFPPRPAPRGGCQNPVPAVIRLAARFRRENGDGPGAATLYEQVIASTPDDVDALAGLIRSLALVDPARAEAYESAMPAVAAAGSASTLEVQIVQSAYRAGRSVAAAPAGPATSGYGPFL